MIESSKYKFFCSENVRKLISIIESRWIFLLWPGFQNTYNAWSNHQWIFFLRTALECISCVIESRCIYVFYCFRTQFICLIESMNICVLIACQNAYMHHWITHAIFSSTVVRTHIYKIKSNEFLCSKDALEHIP